MKKTKKMLVALATVMIMAVTGCTAANKVEAPGNGVATPPVKSENVAEEQFLVSYAYNEYHYSEIIFMIDEMYKATEADVEGLDFSITDRLGENHIKTFVADTKKFYDDQDMFPIFKYLDEKGYRIVKKADFETHKFGEIIEAIFNVEFRELFVASYPDLNIGARHDTRSFIEANQALYEKKDLEKIYDYVIQNKISFVGIRYYDEPAETPTESPVEGETPVTPETPAN